MFLLAAKSKMIWNILQCIHSLENSGEYNSITRCETNAWKIYIEEMHHFTSI